MPRVSVVIPAYNAARFIAEALHSTLAQTYTDVEVVVVDDGSIDGTAEIAAATPGVTTLRQQNAGVSTARNTGVAATRGEFIAFLDADDVWHADKIRAQVALLDRYPESDLTYTRSADDHAAVEGQSALPLDRHSLITELEPTFLHPYLVTSSVMVRRTAFDRVGGFDPSLRYAEDVNFFLRVVLDRPLVPLLECTAVYKRTVANSLGDDSAAGYEKLIALYAHLRDERAEFFQNNRSLISKAFADLHLRHSRCLMRTGERYAAIRAAARSLAARPSAAASIALTTACTPSPLLHAARSFKRKLSAKSAAQ